MYGYAGKLLFVNLSDLSYEIEDLKEEDARNFLGGNALGAKILFDRMPANTPVFAPESMLGFVTGPTNGNLAILGARYTVVSKSPVYDGWNDANSGGTFGPKLKKSGFDGVFFTGIAPKPVYLYINNGAVELRDAANVWGKTIEAAENILREEVGDPRCGIALIGPAGENRSYMAAVMNDTHRAAGRGGSGAVMGSKNLKAVVVSGNINIPVADRDEVIRLNKEGNLWEKEGPVAPIFAAMSQWGTGSAYADAMYSGDGGIKNWLGSHLDLTEEQIQALSSQEMDKLYRKKKFACNACPLGCGAIYEVLESKYHITETGRPEYETSGQFGSLMLNGDPVVVNDCNYLCNEYGFDTISAGGTIAWLMECYNKGLFTIDELDGIDLKWGNGEAIRQVMEKICANEGIGAKLLNGSQYAARTFGKGEECLVVASGIELAQHDSRWSPGLTRTHKYDPTPGRHVKGGLSTHQGNEPAEVKYNYAITGERDVEGVVVNEITHAAGFCLFTDFALPPRAYMDFITAITGFKYEGDEEFHRLGRRMFAMRHAFNLREGLRRKDYTLSARMEGNPPLTEGPLAGVTVDTELIADNFYGVLGWDKETGMIPKEVLESYGGMEHVIAALYGEE